MAKNWVGPASIVSGFSPMSSLSVSDLPTSSKPRKPALPEVLCLIVGLACIAGFAVDCFILAVPPNVGSVQWRVSLLQELADRSLILLFGIALLFYSQQKSRLWKRLLSYLALGLGVLFILSSVITLRDTNLMYQQMITRIDGQTTRLQAQINAPDVAGSVSSERLQQAADLLAGQAHRLKVNSRESMVKTGASTVSNLLILGSSLLGLGFWGSRSVRASRPRHRPSKRHSA